MNALVQLVGVSKTFGGTSALESTDHSFERGKTTVLIGPSGCGKSTILRLIIGLLEPDKGAITLDGAPITPANLWQLRRQIGYVIQETGLFPHFTVERNVGLVPQLEGWAADRVSRARGGGRQRRLELGRDAHRVSSYALVSMRA